MTKAEWGSRPIWTGKSRPFWPGPNGNHLSSVWSLDFRSNIARQRTGIYNYIAQRYWFVPEPCSRGMSLFLPFRTLVPEQNSGTKFHEQIDLAMFRGQVALSQCTPCKIPDTSLVIWLILHLVPWYRNIWHHFLVPEPFWISDKNRIFPEQFNSKGAGVPVRFAPRLRSL